MKDEDYKFFAEMLKKESGLIITPDKIYLLESRLTPLARKRKIEGGLPALAHQLRLGQDPALRQAVVHAMTTNETSFFRDNAPFQRLKDDILPFFCKTRSASKSLRIWSAACSGGQEPYSIAMQLKENTALSGWRCEIVATDLSHDILAQAKAGVYSQFEVQRGLPIQMLVKYFDKQSDNSWVVKPELKELITFKSANLLADFSHLGVFDIVFCRNVLIYFDTQTKAQVLSSIKGSMKPDGTLLLGGTETVMGVTDRFKPLGDMRGIFIGKDSTFVLEKPAVSAQKPPPAAIPQAALQKR